MCEANNNNTPLSVLEQYFGYSAFRDGQEQLINDIVSGKDVLGIMPTGAGKSLCFQVPAIVRGGVAVIVSPLISLMKDQVNALNQVGVRAAYINSSLSEKQIETALRNARNGVYRLVYAAPERLLSQNFLSFARSADISMLTVDEAHCISQWGQDFRPSYAKIPEFIARLPKRPPVSAFTATATRHVRQDIERLLALDNPTVLITGFDRENLYFDLQKPADKFAALLSFLQNRQEGKSGIVYCSTRKNVEDVCLRLRNSGYQSTLYHAGLPDGERHANQDDFLYDRANIMVATNAFGMGIDKSNVSFVVHYNMPKDVESYYQEAGRAGRDGAPADCLLLYNGQDVQTNLWMINNTKDREYPDPETEAQLRERERKRLRDMTFYCSTNDCLRHYILQYFGETPPDTCGNCSNCNKAFVTEDITLDAQKILSCVVRMRERFGVKMIIDVLRGQQNKRLLSFGLDKLSTFGISERSASQLSEIISYLLSHNYLRSSDSEFPVIQLGDLARGVLRGEVTVHMKLADKPKERDAKGAKPLPAKAMPFDPRLYECLRKERLDIAKEQNLPAFVIFADSSLADMCLKLPSTPEEMLNVSGVGQVKMERYGQRFLGVIAEFRENHTMLAATAAEKLIPGRATIEITPEPVSVSVVADRANAVLIRCGYSKISGQRLNNWLAEQGYLTVVTHEEGGSSKVPTDKGREYGIAQEERQIRGEDVLVNQYGPEIQGLIADNILEILGSQ